MTKIIFSTIISSLILSSTSYANANLANIMMQMGADWKILATQITDPAKNASSIAAAKDLINQLTLAGQETPDSVASGAQKQADYQAAISGIQATAQQLLSALQTGDNTAAVGFLSTMKADKAAGHMQFN